MRVGALINTLDRYDRYKRDIATLVYAKQLCEAYDDEDGVMQTQAKIDSARKELGQFLDTEI